MALFDNAMFAPQNYGGVGGLLGNILKMAQANPVQSPGFEQTQDMSARSQAPLSPQNPFAARANFTPGLPAQAPQQQQSPAPSMAMGDTLGSLFSLIAPRHAAAFQQQQQLQQAKQLLSSKGLDAGTAGVVASNPALLAQVMGSQLGVKAPIEVSPGATLFDPHTRKPIFTAPKDQTKTDLEKRADAAGLAPGSQEYRDFMLRGGRNADAPLSATDKKALFAAEDEIPQTTSTIDALNRAIELNDRTFSGFGASTLGTIGNKVPGGSMFVDANKARATQEWEKIMGPESLQAMANTLKGATTDFELKKFIEMLGDPSTDPAVRKSIIQRMKTLADRKLQIQKARVNELRGGTYFKPGGGGSASPEQTTAPDSNDGWGELKVN